MVSNVGEDDKYVVKSLSFTVWTQELTGLMAIFGQFGWIMGSPSAQRDTYFWVSRSWGVLSLSSYLAGPMQFIMDVLDIHLACSLKHRWWFHSIHCIISYRIFSGYHHNPGSMSTPMGLSLHKFTLFPGSEWGLFAYQFAIRDMQSALIQAIGQSIGNQQQKPMS